MSELDPEQPNGTLSAPFLTIREAVLEIRDEVRALASHLDRIDRGGSIGTKAELQDHETRLRSLEHFRFAFPATAALGVLVAISAILVSLFVH